MMADDSLDTPEFQAMVAQLIENESLRASMHEAALAHDTVNAARRLADVVMKTAQQ